VALGFASLIGPGRGEYNPLTHMVLNHVFWVPSFPVYYDLNYFWYSTFQLRHMSAHLAAMGGGVQVQTSCSVMPLGFKIFQAIQLSFLRLQQGFKCISVVSIFFLVTLIFCRTISDCLFRSRSLVTVILFTIATS